LATRLATSSRTPSAKVTGTPRPVCSLIDSVRVDAEFGEGYSAVLRALGSATSDALGGKRFDLLVGSAGFERLSDSV